MAKAIAIGVVGLGWVACARHIPTLRSDPKFQVVGIADRNARRAEEVGKGMPGTRVGSGSNLSQISWIDEVDAVSIATAPMAHHDLVCEALSRGLHVITEKPFAMTVGEGEQMVEVSRSAGRQLAVVHNFQFARSIRCLRSDIDRGRIGSIRGVRALQLGNPSRRLPDWFENLPLGLFYDESPHLLYLLRSLVGPLQLRKAVSVEDRAGRATPHQIDAWFTAEGSDFPITLSCNFVSGVSEWYLLVHGDRAVGIVDIFRDIYLRIPNDRTHATLEVVRTSATATLQHWWQHVLSGLPHLLGTLRYGNDEVFSRFANALAGDVKQLEPISALAALETLSLQHNIIDCREKV
jgi:predicted dehydrogenase